MEQVFPSVQRRVASAVTGPAKLAEVRLTSRVALSRLDARALSGSLSAVRMSIVESVMYRVLCSWLVGLWDVSSCDAFESTLG